MSSSTPQPKQKKGTKGEDPGVAVEQDVYGEQDRATGYSSTSTLAPVVTAQVTYTGSFSTRAGKSAVHSGAVAMLVGAVFAVAAATYRQWRQRPTGDATHGISSLSDWEPSTDEGYEMTLESDYLLPEHNRPRPYVVMPSCLTLSLEHVMIHPMKDPA